MLDHIEEDVSPILGSLEKGVESSIIADLGLKDKNVVEFLECLIKSVSELKKFIRWCILEVLFTSSWRKSVFSDSCL